MADRLPAHVLEHINEAIRAAGLENSSFGFPTELVNSNPHMDPPIVGKHVDAFIRDKVRLHHDSWIIGPLKQILEWSASTDDGSQNEYDILGRLRAKWPNPDVLEQAHKEITDLRSRVADLEAFERKVKGAMEDMAKA